MKIKANCINCGCRFSAVNQPIIKDVDIFGNKTEYITCPICGRHIDKKDLQITK